MIAPIYKELSNTYDDVVFLKVDVDENPETAANYNVSAMPTFVSRFGAVRMIWNHVQLETFDPLYQTNFSQLFSPDHDINLNLTDLYQGGCCCWTCDVSLSLEWYATSFDTFAAVLLLQFIFIV